MTNLSPFSSARGTFSPNIRSVMSRHGGCAQRHRESRLPEAETDRHVALILLSGIWRQWHSAPPHMAGIDGTPIRTVCSLAAYASVYELRGAEDWMKAKPI